MFAINRPYHEKAWPDDEERTAFLKKDKYIAPGHKDIAVHTTG
jgi:hypothetical protein